MTSMQLRQFRLGIHLGIAQCLVVTEQNTKLRKRFLYLTVNIFWTAAWFQCPDILANLISAGKIRVELLI